MSLFGKNIKKIRSIKGLSQQAFADLFGLKRGTLGAYEEGRSEPKIETLIKIANYFSIQIDKLLTSELTVNELLKFKSDITTNVLDLKLEKFALIPCISENIIPDYLDSYQDNDFIDKLPTLQLPLNLEKKFRGFTVMNLEMTKHDKGFYPKDIVIGEFVPNEIIKKIDNGTLVFAITKNKIIFRRLYTTKNNIVLRADHKNIEDITLTYKDVCELWKVRYTFFKRIPEFMGGLDGKLQLLEDEIIKIKNKL